MKLLKFKRIVQEEKGATMVEYGLMVALIAVVCLLTVQVLGQRVQRNFDNVQKNIGDTVSLTPTP